MANSTLRYCLWLIDYVLPSPVYQCKKALRLNMAVNCSEMRLNSSWMAVELPMNVAAILRPRGGMSQTAVLTLLGIHSTKYEEFLFWMLSICSSTSFIDIRPRNTAATVKYLVKSWRYSALRHLLVQKVFFVCLWWDQTMQYLVERAFHSYGRILFLRILSRVIFSLSRRFFLISLITVALVFTWIWI